MGTDKVITMSNNSITPFKGYKDYDNEGGVRMSEGLNLWKTKLIISFKTADKIAQNDALREKYCAFFPLITNLKIKYKAGSTKATIQEPNKSLANTNGKQLVKIAEKRGR